MSSSRRNTFTANPPPGGAPTSAPNELSDDEYHWLTLRAQGSFGATLTCASHVQAQGQGFPGQLGCWSDAHLPGLTRLAAGIKAAGSNAYVQLHHAGMRSPRDLIGTQPVCPSDDAETGARALTLDEVERLKDDFIAAALRADVRKLVADEKARLGIDVLPQPGDAAPAPKLSP